MYVWCDQKYMFKPEGLKNMYVSKYSIVKQFIPELAL